MVRKEVGSFNCPNCGAHINLLTSDGSGKEGTPRAAETVRDALPSDVISDLTIIEKESTFHIVPKKFLGKDKFREIMRVVNDLHGEWVSQGKTSYWWVPKIRNS